MNLPGGGLNRYFFKSDKVCTRAQYLHPEVKSLMVEMIKWAAFRQITPLITETVTTLKEDAALKRVSSSHREGRAFDMRNQDWKPEQIKEFVTHFEKLYGSKGAIGGTTLKPNLIEEKEHGSGPHFHVQFNKNYAMALPAELEGK